jgi:hypothetical protein
VGHEGRPRFIHVWREQFKAEAMAFEDIDEGIIKAFAIGKHGGHEIGRVVMLEERCLIRLHAVSGGMRPAKGIMERNKRSALREKS